MSAGEHIPVLLEETMGVLAPRPGEVALDCTVGLGGHSRALAAAVGPGGTVVGFDLDAANLARAAASIGSNFTAIGANFTSAPEELRRRGLRADMVLADLGFSSNQMDDPARGFSFSQDGPLDMRLSPDLGVTAADLIAGLPEPQLADLIYNYGEDPLARVIARKVAQNRRVQPIRTTAMLARLITEAYGPRARSSRMHPATRTFMALRIAVNDELGSLRGLLDHIVRGAEQVDRGGWLRPGARIALISFHSLEDRLIKHAFADIVKRRLATLLTRKPITPSASEAQGNPRSRSAKLRAVKVGDPLQQPDG